MIEKDLYSGLIRLHILHHACLEPIFGAGIIEELARHGYRLSPGTVYPLLHGLEEKGYLRAAENEKGGQGRRVYRATPKGRKALTAAREKVRELFAELVEEEEEEHLENNPLQATATAKVLMKELYTRLREDAQQASEPGVQALLETSAAVLKGLHKAFDEFQKRSEVE